MSEDRYTYRNDRSYTDSVHDNLAIKIIYPQMGWTPKKIDNELAAMKDSEYSIDYHAVNAEGVDIVIQERFRRPNKAGFDDFTLRYEREENSEEIEQKSEFFKMKGKLRRFKEPFYMVYGILNINMDGFSKYVILDLRAFFEHFNNKEIIVDPQIRFSRIQDNILYCGVNGNFDNSSSFMCASIKHLIYLFKDVIIYQEGFVVSRTGDATDKQISYLKDLAIKNGFILQNENFLSKADARPLIDLLKDKERCKSIHQLIASGELQKIAMFLTTKKSK